MSAMKTASIALISLTASLCLAAFLRPQWLAAGAGRPVNSRMTAAAPQRSTSRGGAHPVVPSAQEDEKYPYQTLRFTQLLEESDQACRSREARRFYSWLDQAYRRSPCRLPGKERLGLEALLAATRRELAGTQDRAQWAKAEMALGAWLHRLVKTTIPRFSLDRGFEFSNVVRYGERQCFLQAVLIAGLLQRSGVKAGVAMVYRNLHGQETNNGHAVTLVRLSDGRDLIVDASDPEPFARQQGLYVRAGDYRYVDPVYEGRSGRITAYRAMPGKEKLSPAQVRTLDLAFIRSQFWYYRGERREGGLLSRAKTRAGLAAAEADLRKSAALCPRNPLAVYMLGRVYHAQGKTDEAHRLFERAHRLYAGAGWVPAGPRQYLALTSRPRGRASGA